MSDSGSNGRKRGGKSSGSGDRSDRSADPDIRKHRTQMKENYKQYFEKEGLEPGDVELDEKMPAGKRGNEKLTTNLYGVLVKPKLPVFQYDVTIEGLVPAPNDKTKTIAFTKKSLQDPIVIDRKNNCRVVMKAAIEKYIDFFFNRNNVFYDLQSLLYSTRELTADGVFPKIMQDGAILCVFLLENPNSADWQYFLDANGEPLAYFKQFLEIGLYLRRVVRETELIAGNNEIAFNGDITTFDRSSLNFLELVISQYPLFNPNEFVSFPKGRLYLLQPQEYLDADYVERMNGFSDTKYVGAGLKKSMKYVEGPKGRGYSNTALIIAPLKTVFFRNMTVAEYLLAGINQNNMSEAKRIMESSKNRVKNLVVYNPNLRLPRKFVVTRFNLQGPRNTFFVDRNGVRISTEEYFLREYGVRLRFPDVFMVCGKNPNEQLPIEVAVIDDNQIAQKSQLTSREDANMVRLAAQLPSALKREVERWGEALHLNSEIFAANNITCSGKPLAVDGRIVNAPTIKYQGNAANVSAADGKWLTGMNKYYRPGTGCQWALIKIGQFQFDRERVIDTIVQTALRKGINLPPKPVDYHEVVYLNDLKDSFERVKSKNGEFIIAITDIKIQLQGLLKKLERDYEIGTQNITSKVAQDITGRGRATLENVFSKFNVKLGGLNYDVDLSPLKNSFGSAPLIIGISLSHAGSIDKVQQARGGTVTSRKLSALGFAANTNPKAQLDFVGDHIPSTPHRNEVVDLIASIVGYCTSRFVENRGRPTSVVIYLNGSSEGDFEMLLRYEVPLIQRALKSHLGDVPPFTIIVPNKLHLIRIFREKINENASVTEQNLAPGTVVDYGIVHPRINEFYLNSHSALLGTSRVPRYIILRNKNKNADLDSIITLTHYLTFGYQIVTSTTSLPSPCMIAQQYADRGSKIYPEITDTSDENLIKDRYGYRTSEKFRNIRINA
uniref:Piwi domain-containing protein n=1 Tax=Panagrolaimus sp. JU765 TaxID=591449 RepID=A0AC34QL35_9BILA